MNHFSPSLYIAFCIATSECIGNQTVAYHRAGEGKKGQASLFVAQEIVESSATTDFQMCHLSQHLSYERKAFPERERARKGRKKIIIGVFFFYLFPLFPRTSSVNKIKMPPFLSRREEHLWAEQRGASEIDGPRIRSE